MMNKNNKIVQEGRNFGSKCNAKRNCDVMEHMGVQIWNQHIRINLKS
jgi:hypothetical protein